MTIQLLSILFLTIFVTSVTSGRRFLYDFDPVPSSANTPLETDPGASGGAVVGVVTNPAVRVIQAPLANCNGASLPLGNDVHLTIYNNDDKVPLITKFVDG